MEDKIIASFFFFFKGNFIFLAKRPEVFRLKEIHLK